MFVLGLGTGQSSFTVSLSAKKYFLRSSVIYSESRRVCDGLPPLLSTRLSSGLYVRECAFHSATRTPPSLPLSPARCAEAKR